MGQCIIKRVFSQDSGKINMFVLTIYGMDVSFMGLVHWGLQLEAMAVCDTIDIIIIPNNYIFRK